MTRFFRRAMVILIATVLSGCSPGSWFPSKERSVAGPREIHGLDAENRVMKLSHYRGQVVLVDFWMTHCGPCMKFAKDERSLLKQFAKRPFAVLGVNVDPDREMLVKTQAHEQLAFRSWYDGPDGPIKADWHVRAFPTIYLIDHHGNIRFHSEGAPPTSEVAAMIEPLLQEAEKQAHERGK